MIKNKNLLTYLKIFTLCVFILLISGCDAFETIQGNFTTYNPNNIPCIANGECILVCGWKNRGVFNGIDINFNYADFCGGYPHSPKTLTNETIDLGAYVYLRVKDGADGKGTVGDFYLAYNNACRGLKYTKEDKGVKEIKKEDLSKLIHIEDNLPIDIANGKCPDNFFIQDARSEPELCVDKNVGQKDEGNTWCYKKYDQSVTTFRGESQLVYSLGEKIDSESDSLKSGIENYYKNKGLASCEEKIKIEKDYNEISNVVTYSNLRFLINGKTYPLDIVSSEMESIIVDLVEEAQKNLYSEETIKANLGEILYHAKVELGPKGYANFKYPSTADANSGLLKLMLKNVTNEAFNYLNPNDAGKCEVKKILDIQASYYYVSGTCGAYARALYGCIADIYNQADKWRKEGKITAEVANTVESALREFENGVIEEITGKAIVEISFDDWDFTSKDCEAIVGENFKVFFKLVYTAIEIAAPILMLILSMVDFTKATAAGEDAFKEATSKLVKRAIVLVLIFVLPILIKLIGTLAGLDITCLF